MTQKNITVPLVLEHECPLVELEWVGEDGRSTHAPFLVDTGGGPFLLLTEDFAQQAGISVTSENAIQEWDVFLVSVPQPEMVMGGVRLALETRGAFIKLRKGASHADIGMVPGYGLVNYRVIFDFPQRQFRLVAHEDASTPRGKMLPTPIHSATRFPRIEIEIDGVRYGMLLDTGAGCTMISPAFFDQLAGLHPDWLQITGALGTANKGVKEIDQYARMLRIPSLQVGTLHLEGLCVVARPRGGNFEQFSAQNMTGPVVGALGCNLLKHFCVEIDYAQGVTYLEQQTELDQHDMEMVGLTMCSEDDGSYRIIAVAEQNDPHTLESIHVEDRLVQINKQDIKKLSLSQVIDALRGEPGQVYTLQLERNQTSLEVQVPTARLL